MTSPRKGRRAVIGIDFGTLSGLGEVPGMCGVVRDGITPGLWGYEARQSGVGDIFAWQVRNATLHDYFGRGTNDVMHRLRALQRAAGRA